MNFMVVPMKVDALIVPRGKQRSVLGPTSNYESMPWFDGERDRFPSTPNLASSLHSEPFADHSVWLESGVHLHWALPDGLTRGTTRRGAPGTVPVDELNFPPVPNQWLIIRYPSTDMPNRDKPMVRWSVRSDAIDAPSDSMSVTYPVDAVDGRRWIRLGSQRRLAENETFADFPSHTLATSGAPLTALGPADPYFSALYANCRSVFGCHDTDDAVAGRRYDVLGWFASVDDPLSAVVADAVNHGADVAAVVLERFGWQLADQATPMPTKMLCVGRVTLGGDEASWEPQELERDVRNDKEGIITEPVAVGNTPTEAIAAAVSADASDGNIERQLEAMHLAPSVAHHDIDFGLKFEEARHSAQFTAVAGPRCWTLRPAADAANPSGVNQGTAMPSADLSPIPRNIVDDLHVLNQLQRNFDEAQAQIDWRRQELHGRWQQLMMGLYDEPPTAPDNLDLPRLETLIARDHLGPLERLIAETGEIGLHTKSPSDTLGGAVDWQLAVMTADLAAYNTNRSGLDRLELVLSPGPRFWQPNEPVVMLPSTHFEAGEAPHPRHGADGVLTCAAIEGLKFVPILKGDASWSIDRFLTASFWDENQHLVGFSGGTPWNPVMLEWEVELRPLDEGGNQSGNGASSGGHYATDFVTSSQDLVESSPDFQARSADPVLAHGFEYLSGRTVLQPSTMRVFREQLNASIAEARDNNPDAIRGLNIARSLLNDVRYDSATVQSLGGFNEALLMRRAERQPPIADPIGFPPQQELAQRIADVLDGFHPSSIVPGAPFHPIRSGRLIIERLRIIDSFGQSREWRPSVVHTSEALRSNETNRVHLPIRITQPAMMSFRWLMAGQTDREMNDHPETGPICGWLLTNFADRAIDVYDAEGHQLGSIEASAGWQPAPGVVAAPATPSDISDETVASLVGWILTRPDAPSFIAEFVTTTGRALDAIDPQDHRAHESRALLIGRPMAIVNAALDLRLAGRPAVDQSWSHLREQTLGAAPSDHGVGDVEFEVRLGDPGLLNDGLVAYWEIGDRGDFSEQWKTPYSAASPKTTVTIGDPARRLVMIVDPRGSVHATSGILPTKEIRITPTHSAEALDAIAATFLTAPILTPTDNITVPLPGEPGFSWSWLQRLETAWIEIPEHESVDLSDVLDAFPGRGREVWDTAVAAGVLVPNPRAPQRARLESVPTAPGMAASGPGVLSEAEIRALHQIATAIRPARTDATFDATVIREGWLKLRPQTSPLLGITSTDGPAEGDS
jgi:hypothetical protein